MYPLHSCKTTFEYNKSSTDKSMLITYVKGLLVIFKRENKILSSHEIFYYGTKNDHPFFKPGLVNFSDTWTSFRIKPGVFSMNQKV